MEKFNLIIPSAKLVSEEMQNLGKLPAALYLIESKTVLQRLNNYYKEATDEICLVGCEGFHKFEEYFQRDKSLQNIDLVKMDNLGDLGKTIYVGLQEIKKNSDLKRVVVNFGDTLVFEELDTLPKDGFYYSEDVFSNTWTFFEDDENGIKRIIDKENGNNNIDLNIKKLFVGVFSFSDIDYLIECFRNINNNNKMDSFYEVLLEYNKKYPLKAIKTNTWCDVGHQDKYFNAQLGVKAREFNHITIDSNRGILTKTSSERAKFEGEILWYIKLPKDLEYVRPRIFSYSLEYNNTFVSMEYYSYYTLHELLLYSDISKKQWNNIFNKIKFICEDFSRYKVSGDNIIKSLEKVYIEKTIQRLNKLRENSFFEKYFEQSFYVNGKRYKKLLDIIEILKNELPNILFKIKDFSIIHGDLCFSNILVDSDNSFVKLIDPRGNFGSYDIYGDSRYELAKLFHSIDGKYDYIIEEQFDLSIDENGMEYKIKEQKRDFDIYKEFLNVFDKIVKNQRREIEIIEALLFLSMIPLHNESLRQQCVMLATGVEILARHIDILE